MPTYTLISSNVLTTTAASVTFTAIPSTYTDLVLRISARTNANVSNDNFRITFNSDSGSNYSITRITGNGSTAVSNRLSNQTSGRAGAIDGNTATSSTFGSVEIYIPNYLVSANKPYSSTAASEQNATAAQIDGIAGLWRNTAAITSISIESNNLNVPTDGYIVSGSSFYLYGI